MNTPSPSSSSYFHPAAATCAKLLSPPCQTAPGLLSPPWPAKNKELSGVDKLGVKGEVYFGA